MRWNRILLATAAALLASGPLAAEFPHPPLPPPPPLPRIDVRVVPAPPPPPRHLVRIERPGRGYVWIDGYWDYGPGGWTWVDGRWGVPPVHGVHWIRARYERVHGGWHYVPGHWSSQRVVWEERHDHGRHRGWDRH